MSAGGATTWPVPWQARWIWAEGPKVADHRQVIVARRAVDLERVPDAAPLRVFAEAGYVLSVNGVEVSRGPGRGNPRSRRYDTLDIADHLVAGSNVFDLVGVHHGRANAWWMPGPKPFPTGVARGGVVLEADLGQGELFVTDSRWHARVVDGWTTTVPTGAVSARGREVIDLRTQPALGHEPEEGGDDDHDGWRPALERPASTLGDPDRTSPPSYPFGPAGPSTLSAPTVRDLPLVHAGDGVWCLDEVAVGTLVVSLEGRAGDAVGISTAEQLDADGSPIPPEEDVGVDLVAGEGPCQVETIDRFGLRAATVHVAPSTTVTAITLRERTHPVTGDARFACSDPVLDDIWAVGRRTVSLCSLDAYVDCPTREQRAWTGDAVVHQLVDLTTNADWTLARWNPHLVASPRPDGMLPMAVAGDIEASDYTVIPDWALHWVRSVWNLHRWVGDEDEIVALLPVVERVVSWFDQFLDPSTGLPTDVYGWVIIDWASVPTEGASAALTGLLGRALTDLADLADFVGDGGRAARARGRHDDLRQAFEAFWDPERARYADTLVDGTRGPTASQHGQAAALVAGFAPEERHARLVELLVTGDHLVHATYSVADGPAPPGSEAPIGGDYMVRGHPAPWWDTDTRIVAAQPFFRYVVHDALAEAAGPT